MASTLLKLVAIVLLPLLAVGVSGDNVTQQMALFLPLFGRLALYGVATILWVAAQVFAHRIRSGEWPE